MRTDKQKAFALRLSGKSYRDISATLHIPKSTLSSWFSNVQLSEDVRNKINEKGRKKSIQLLLERNKKQTELAAKRNYKIRKESSEEIRDISSENLLLIGVALYWAEGHKKMLVRNGQEVTSHPVSLTNSDPVLVKVFLRFIREICNVDEDRIKASVRMFDHQNEQHVSDYWRGVTGIKKENFCKTYTGISKSSQGKRPYNRLPYGTIQIRVSDTKLFHRIIGLIEGLKKKCSYV
ncbi:MAG: Resolvase helix-turn-helix protein [uncultured bacterium]|uniref:Resolvase helix-turn-helix domain protein n=2 Tax=Candidatus Wolfeibacteriota TaxID=1752735 RepID=A0A0G1JIB3_9BACT|nr:MAG: Resolvase helix-turn-helix protein [uncultured bacterium]KKR12791.1 MAG: hypothetical protein UT41_C0001G0335 [Candidatus Wolfebacteria bacterium GW2011_GWC2_39_22]KKT43722.1 MAG: hypothetical protein UW32_C0001G0314 [Candidatus Wolfebacteria bacterium GW2011_GWE2_44_13]HBI25547.1 hypothetical protein [Candidatus Wolfebacteria bacterium]